MNIIRLKRNAFALIQTFKATEHITIINGFIFIPSQCAAHTQHMNGTRTERSAIEVNVRLTHILHQVQFNMLQVNDLNKSFQIFALDVKGLFKGGVISWVDDE